MTMSLSKTVQAFDDRLAAFVLPLAGERGALLTFLVHSLFQTTEEANCGLLDPQQAFTVAMLREFLAHFCRAGYRFLSPCDLKENPSPQGKYALLTFDDGYYNNARALPLLEEFQVPALFFISSDQVKQGKAFWWDALYREFRKRERPRQELDRLLEEFKRLRTSQIESEISARFGRSALRPVSDLDRPFTPNELKKFAAHPLVFLGNHSRDHSILTNYSRAGVREQIASCQNSLRELTGQSPQCIAYPNGNCSPEICKAAREAGLRFGLLARSGRNRLPLKGGSDTAMAIKRFTLWGDRPVEAQCLASRSPWSFVRVLRGLRQQAEISSRLAPHPPTKGKAFARSAGS